MAEIELEIIKGTTGFVQQDIRLKVSGSSNKKTKQLLDYSLEKLDIVLKKSLEKEK